MKYLVTFATEVEAEDMTGALAALYLVTNPRNFYNTPGITVKLPLRIVRVEERPEVESQREKATA